jgi:hypothetical protein
MGDHIIRPGVNAIMELGFNPNTTNALIHTFVQSNTEVRTIIMTAIGIIKQYSTPHTTGEFYNPNVPALMYQMSYHQAPPHHMVAPPVHSPTAYSRDTNVDNVQFSPREDRRSPEPYMNYVNHNMDPRRKRKYSPEPEYMKSSNKIQKTAEYMSDEEYNIILEKIKITFLEENRLHQNAIVAFVEMLNKIPMEYHEKLKFINLDVKINYTRENGQYCKFPHIKYERYDRGKKVYMTEIGRNELNRIYCANEQKILIKGIDPKFTKQTIYLDTSDPHKPVYFLQNNFKNAVMNIIRYLYSIQLNNKHLWSISSDFAFIREIYERLE